MRTDDARRPRLVVVAGRPGTGKTTLARALTAELGATYLRVDAVETALRVARGHEVTGPEGYAVVHQLALSNLELGRDVVVDAVCPVPESRTPWVKTARSAAAHLTVLETVLPDPAEHRRRVDDRRPDMPGQRVPRWPEVEYGDYAAWDEVRDDARTVVDTTSDAAAVTTVGRLLGLSPGDPPR